MMSGLVSCIVRRRAVITAAVGMRISMGLDTDGYGLCDQSLWAYGDSMEIFSMDVRIIAVLAL